MLVHRCTDKDECDSFPTVNIVYGETKEKDHNFIISVIILCARSTVFKAMLSSNMTENTTKTIKILDFEPDVVRLFLNYLRTDQIRDCSLTTHSQNLLKLAHKYDVTRLFNVCEINLANNLTINNIIEILKLADTYEAKYLTEVSIEFTVFHHTEICKTYGNDCFSEQLYKGFYTKLIERLAFDPSKSKIQNTNSLMIFMFIGACLMLFVILPAVWFSYTINNFTEMLPNL